jgi:glycerophosphoryl diester phosphodiesterase
VQNFRSNQKPLVIAHRGSTNPAPENTIAAFEAAIDLQADMIEFDVRSTKDQVLVIHHDPAVDRKPIHQLTWAELHAINPLIPTLEATIQCGKGRILLDVELKEIGQETQTIDQLLQHFQNDEFVITSFNLESLQVIKQNYPEITIGLLLNRSWQERILDRNDPFLPAHIAQLQPNFLAPNEQLWNTPWLQQINVNNLPYWVWTVNQAEKMQDFMQHPNVHAIITDQVSLGLAVRHSRTSNPHD